MNDPQYPRFSHIAQFERPEQQRANISMRQSRPTIRAHSVSPRLASNPNVETMPEKTTQMNYFRPVIQQSIFSQIPNPECDPEFAITNMGIDLSATEPLIPDVYYVGSDAPMIQHSQYPVPTEFLSAQENIEPDSRICVFSDETLLFIFYLHVKDRLQIAAYDELCKRGYAFDRDNKFWKNKEGLVFNTDSWKFSKLEDAGRVSST